MKHHVNFTFFLTFSLTHCPLCRKRLLGRHAIPLNLGLEDFGLFRPRNVTSIRLLISEIFINILYIFSIGNAPSSNVVGMSSANQMNIENVASVSTASKKTIVQSFDKLTDVQPTVTKKNACPETESNKENVAPVSTANKNAIGQDSDESADVQPVTDKNTGDFIEKNEQ